MLRNKRNLSDSSFYEHRTLDMHFRQSPLNLYEGKLKPYSFGTLKKRHLKIYIRITMC